MKNLIKLLLILVLISSLSSCNKKAIDVVTPADGDYQQVIDAKFKSIGWAADGHVKFNNSSPIKTAGGKGWVQYYAFGDRKKAIYYFDKAAYAVDTEEMKGYDNAGQDNFGTIISDWKATITGGCGFNEIITADGKEAVIICQTIVKGEIYAKYKEMGRWDGPLGLPTAGELPTPADNGRFGSFQNGTIWSFPATGTHALWGKVLAMYKSIDYERSWLGKPIESCDPKKGDGNQTVAFEKGKIGTSPGGKCGTYYEPLGLPRLQNGKSTSDSSTIPCY